MGPFICQATFPLQECEPVFAELKGLESELVLTLGIEPARDPIYVYLFSNEKAHRQYLAKHFPNVPPRRALFVREGGLAGVYAYRHKQLDVDLRHECTHALLHASLPYVPLWLDEGLAKYFEVPENERAFDHPYFGDLRWNLRVGMVQSIDELEQRRDISEMGASEYRDAWAWVHFMFHGPTGGHAALVQYLADVRKARWQESCLSGWPRTSPTRRARWSSTLSTGGGEGGCNSILGGRRSRGARTTNTCT